MEKTRKGVTRKAKELTWDEVNKMLPSEYRAYREEKAKRLRREQEAARAETMSRVAKADAYEAKALKKRKTKAEYAPRPLSDRRDHLGMTDSLLYEDQSHLYDDRPDGVDAGNHICQTDFNEVSDEDLENDPNGPDDLNYYTIEQPVISRADKTTWTYLRTSAQDIPPEVIVTYEDANGETIYRLPSIWGD